MLRPSYPSFRWSRLIFWSSCRMIAWSSVILGSSWCFNSYEYSQLFIILSSWVSQGNLSIWPYLWPSFGSAIDRCFLFGTISSELPPVSSWLILHQHSSTYQVICTCRLIDCTLKSISHVPFWGKCVNHSARTTYVLYVWAALKVKRSCSITFPFQLVKIWPILISVGSGSWSSC